MEKWEIALGTFMWVNNRYDPVIQASQIKCFYPYQAFLASWKLTVHLLTVGKSVRSCVTLCYTKPQDNSQYEEKIRPRTGCHLQKWCLVKEEKLPICLQPTEIMAEICQRQAAPHSETMCNYLNVKVINRCGGIFDTVLCIYVLYRIE